MHAMIPFLNHVYSLTLCVSALVCLLLSLAVTLGVLIVGLGMAGHHPPFMHRPRGERLTVYRALCQLPADVLLTIIYAQTLVSGSQEGSGSDSGSLCLVSRAVWMGSLTARGILVVAATLTACRLVFWQTDLAWGWRDFRVLMAAMLPSALLSSLTTVFGVLRSFIVSCHGDVQPEWGALQDVLRALPVMVTCVVVAVVYVACWTRLDRPRVPLTPCQSPAKTLLLHAASWFAEAWALALYSFWHLLDPNVPIFTLIFLVTFPNLAGVFNGVVHGQVRRRSRRRTLELEGHVRARIKGPAVSAAAIFTVLQTASLQTALARRSTSASRDGDVPPIVDQELEDAVDPAKTGPELSERL